MIYDDARLYVIHDIMGSKIRVESKSTGRVWESDLGQPLPGGVSPDTAHSMTLTIVKRWRRELKGQLALHCQGGLRVRYPLTPGVRV